MWTATLLWHDRHVEKQKFHSIPPAVIQVHDRRVNQIKPIKTNFELIPFNEMPLVKIITFEAAFWKKETREVVYRERIEGG